MKVTLFGTISAVMDSKRLTTTVTVSVSVTVKTGMIRACRLLLYHKNTSTFNSSAFRGSTRYISNIVSTIMLIALLYMHGWLCGIIFALTMCPLTVDFHNSYISPSIYGAVYINLSFTPLRSNVRRCTKLIALNDYHSLFWK